MLLAPDAVETNHKKVKRWTPLSQAVWCGNDTIINLLLDTGKVDVPQSLRDIDRFRALRD